MDEKVLPQLPVQPARSQQGAKKDSKCLMSVQQGETKEQFRERVIRAMRERGLLLQ